MRMQFYKHKTFYTLDILGICLLFIIAMPLHAQKVTHKYILIPLPSEIQNQDTIAHYQLPRLYVFPPEKFKNKRQERFYWKTVRDVKKVLPIARMVKRVLDETNDTIAKLSEKEAKRYLKGLSKRIYKENEGAMRHLTLRQGKLLIQLIDRECGSSSYDLIKEYRGAFTAGFYQVFARMFGASLKKGYGESARDKMIERIIMQVEAGTL